MGIQREPRGLLAGAGPKPPAAAWIKSPGGANGAAADQGRGGFLAERDDELLAERLGDLLERLEACAA